MFSMICCRDEESIARLERGLHHGKLGNMRIVAIDAVVTDACSPAQIPVTIHASMRTPCVVPDLRAVALGAQVHHVGIRYRTAVGQPQRVAVIWVMAGVARQVAMLQLHILMELLQVRRRSARQVGLANTMARRTGNPTDSAQWIRLLQLDQRRTSRATYVNRKR